MDPVDPKRRGRRLFGRRRHEHAAEDQMDEPTTTVPDASASGTVSEARPDAADPSAGDPPSPAVAIGTLAGEVRGQNAPTNEVEVLEDISVVEETDSPSGAATIEAGGPDAASEAAAVTESAASPMDSAAAPVEAAGPAAETGTRVETSTSTSSDAAARTE